MVVALNYYKIIIWRNKISFLIALCLYIRFWIIRNNVVFITEIIFWNYASRNFFSVITAVQKRKLFVIHKSREMKDNSSLPKNNCRNCNYMNVYHWSTFEFMTAICVIQHIPHFFENFRISSVMNYLIKWIITF